MEHTTASNTPSAVIRHYKTVTKEEDDEGRAKS
jgi:hypothetical protein